MMNFRTINSAIIGILGAAAAGRFTVVGYARQVKHAGGPLVQSYYKMGKFPKSSGRRTASKQHDMTFSIGLTVSSPAKADLAAINNPNATPVQIAAALNGVQEAAAVADFTFDELADTVFQILLDARNQDLGQAIGVISNLWINSIEKNEPEPAGSLVVLTGVIELECSTVETVVGDEGVASESISTVLDLHGDNTEKTGVTV